MRWNRLTGAIAGLAGAALLLSLPAAARADGGPGDARELEIGGYHLHLDLPDPVITGNTPVVVTVLFAMIYQFLPDVDLRLRHVWVGALVTAGLFNIGKYLIGLYLGTSGVASAYGAAGSVVVLLVWVYYSSQTVLLGAEFTRAWVERFGGPRPTVSPHATRDPRPEATGGKTMDGGQAVKG